MYWPLKLEVFHTKTKGANLYIRPFRVIKDTLVFWWYPYFSPEFFKGGGVWRGCAIFHSFFFFKTSLKYKKVIFLENSRLGYVLIFIHLPIHLMVQNIQKALSLFGSDRSPRRGDLVRSSVRACVCDIIQNNSENDF